jgi:hypothetical protein
MLEQKKPPTVQALLALLDATPVKVVHRLVRDGKELRGYWDDGTIYVGISRHRSGKFEEMVLTGLHELCHAYYENCGDGRTHHDKIYRWEFRLFASKALWKAMAVRLANAAVFRVVDP